MTPGLVIAMSLAAGTGGGDRPLLEAAAAAARWIDAHSVASEHGVVWPAEPSNGHVQRHLYNGTPGVILFFLQLHEATGDEHWLARARLGADDLKAALDVPEMPHEAGLWTGVAGQGFALHQVHLATGDAKYLEAARAAVRLVSISAVRDEDGLHWNTGTDIISGAAGIGLFMLYANEHLGDDKALPVAVEAGNWLLAQADGDAHGVDDSGPGLEWKMTPESTYVMPNFSHGGAGIGFFLARLHETLDDGEQSRFRHAAIAAGRHLTAIANTSKQGCVVAHHIPGGEDLYYLGWCHGPVGTSRLFRQLARITDDRSWLHWSDRGAGSILASGIPARRTAGFWNNVGQCCGTAGVAAYFLDMHRRTGRGEHLAFARAMTADLLARAVTEQDEQGRVRMHWPQAEHRVRPELIASQTGYMQGAAGIGLWLLALDAHEQGRPLTLRFPDDLAPGAP